MSASNKQEEPPDSSNDYILRFGLLTLIFIGVVTYNLAALPRLDTFVQMLILVAIAINTGETRRMQKEMVRQTRLSMVPGFTVEYFKDGREEALKLINIGNGVATSISIAPLDVEYPFQGQVLLYM